MAEFAKAQLLKYGWTEGKGLGKQEDGIVEALKPKLKFDTTGVGHKSNICNNWWDSVFNKAAKNVSVDKSSSGVSLNVVDQDAAIFSNKQDLKSLQKEHRSGYKSFLKTSTLENGKVTQEKRRDIKLEVKPELPNFIISDDELFKTCEGRTAHKGARHGLNLNGKLARIAQQEKEMLAALSLQKGSIQPKEIAEKKDKLSKKKEKRKRKAAETESEEDIIDEDNKDISHLLNTSKDKSHSNKAQRKSAKKKMNTLAQMLDKSCKLEENQEGAIGNSVCSLHKKRKKTASNDATNEFIYSKSVEKMTRLCKEMEKIIEKCKKHGSKNESNCDTHTAKDEDDYLDLFKDITFKRYEQQDPEKFMNQTKHKLKNKTDDKKMIKLSQQLDNSCSLSGKVSKKKKKKSRDRFVLQEDVISRIDANKLNSKIEKKKRKRLLKEQSLALLVKNISSKSKVKSELSDFV